MDIMIKATLDAYAPLNQLEIKGINVVNELPEIDKALTNTLYVSTTDNIIAITLDNSKWVMFYPGYVGDGSDGSLTNVDKLVTLDYLNSKLDELKDTYDEQITELHNLIDELRNQLNN